MLTCGDTERVISSYLDGELGRGERASVDAHLRECLVCRLRLSETRAVVRDLASVTRPMPSPALAASINRTLTIERAARRAQPAHPLSSRLVGWVRPHVMPYTVGAFASLLLFVGVMSALRPQLAALQSLAAASRAPIVVPLAPGEAGYDVTPPPVSLEGYAATRNAFRGRIPQPQSARRARRAGVDAPERPTRRRRMIVVADVYGNGSASLAAVVEPPRNPRMLDDLQDAAQEPRLRPRSSRPPPADDARRLRASENEGRRADFLIRYPAKG